MDFSIIGKEYQDNGIYIVRNAIDSSLAKQIVKHVNGLKTSILIYLNLFTITC